jgi:orotate phosphoribosyltransferase
LSDEIMQIFKTVGVVKEGHFLLTSGLHSSVYWEKFRILQYPHYTSMLCQLIAEHFIEKKVEVELVVGPTTGGIILAFEVARQMGVKNAFTEKEGLIRIFRRDFNIIQDERVLVVDDVMTTGSSVKETIKAVRKLGGYVVGVGLLVDRSENKVDFDVPSFSCIKSPAITYSADNCPLCAKHIPLVKPGSHS